MKHEELKILRQAVEAMKEQIDHLDMPEEQGPEQIGEPPALDGQGRLEELENEAMWLRNHLLTVRERVEKLEERADGRCKACEKPLDERTQKEAGMNGFVAGVILAWIVVALGVFVLLMGWQILKWSAQVLGLSVPLLGSFLLLFLLALTLQKKAKTVVE